MECKWCGNAHDVKELCRARRVSRRMFLFTASVAAVGAVLPDPFPCWNQRLFIAHPDDAYNIAYSFKFEGGLWLAT